MNIRVAEHVASELIGKLTLITIKIIVITTSIVAVIVIQSPGLTVNSG